MSDFDPTQPNPNDNESTKPGERLRRLLASSQEEGETLPPLPESPDMESTTASLAEEIGRASCRERV